MRRDPHSETSSITKPVVDALNAIPGVWARRLHSGTVRMGKRYIYLGEEGCPDVFALVRGIGVFVETKKGKELVTERQLEEHARIRRAGGIVFVVRTAKAAVDEVRKLLVIQDEKRGAA